MSELTLLLLRFGFLIILWAFVFAVVYALRTDLFGQRVRRLPADVASGAVAASPPFVASAVAPPVAPAPAWGGGTASDATEAFEVQPNRGNSSLVATRLVITSGPKEGLELSLPKEPLTIGRSSESGLVIRDDYTSTHHARLMLWSEDWVIQDLDSTNGTFLNGTRVTLPTPVPLNTPVRIGTTSFELRR
ncbi:FHA domain-containing protein [Glaciihabitans sp. INWT7]|uniref:FHA domain-containing protein FhaB/FipA n=1 Tax=Glaciihabitans sp. INWT7 TaxID=2596912 RepID=UPI0016261A03|nr:FHA domain-containing protein [Glaciihabitans sp. INWT7]QNE45488.1 FHA domain-containing protein [Glaciihabitans sp. INWT7]